MDENEAYNRGLKGQKRGYLYDIMTNPNYGFTNATRQGAGANLGFDVEMPQNPQERMFVVDPEVMRRNGSWLTDENTGLPTNMVPGSILSKIFQPKSAMSEAVQNFDTTMGRQDVRADYMREASQHMGMLGQALGFGSGEPYNTNTWDAVNTGNPNTVYTGGHGTNSLASYANTRSQKQISRPAGESGKTDPLTKPSNIILVGAKGKRYNKNLPLGLKQILDKIDKNIKLVETLAQVGKTFINPMTGLPMTLLTEDERIKYLNDFRSIASNVIQEALTIDPSVGVPVIDSAYFNIAMGQGMAMNQLGGNNPNQNTLLPTDFTPIPKTGWSRLNPLSDPDSQMVIPNKGVVTKTPGDDPLYDYQGKKYNKAGIKSVLPNFDW